MAQTAAGGKTVSDSSFNFRPGQPRLNLRFEIVDGPRAGEVLPPLALPEPGEAPILIGRSRECAIWIDASDISRRHTEIFSSQDRRPMVRDMGSVNGTIVNGQPVSPTTPIPLNPGDHIRVGLTEFRYFGPVAPTAGPTGIPAQPGMGYPSGPVNPSPATTMMVNNPLMPPALIGGAINQPSPIRAATLPGEYYIYLVVRGGQRYLFEGEEATVGRGQANDIVIDSNSMSRQHARLQKTVTGVVVTDLGSTNKTFVNNVQADGPVLLRDNDVLRFGDIEVDFKLEPQRLTNYVPLISRDNPNFGLETTVNDTSSEITARETTMGDQTFMGSGGFDQTFVGGGMDQTFVGAGSDPLMPSFKSKANLEQSETALDLDIRDIRVVGRNLRQASNAIPDAEGRNLARTPSGNLLAEVARIEQMVLSEGAGRAQEIILNGIRLGLKPGELVALVGPSGCGKSELLQVMAGLRAADQGTVTVMGRNLPTSESNGGARPNLENDRDLNNWRYRSLGYLSRDPEFNPKQSALDHVMWVLEQAGFGRDPRERLERAQEKLRWAGFSGPELMQLRPADLNRSERKQLALARALALDPPLILADEPTGRMPSATADKVFQLLKQLAKDGRTVFMVTSDLLWARNTDRQIEILDGVIVGSLS